MSRRHSETCLLCLEMSRHDIFWEPSADMSCLDIPNIDEKQHGINKLNTSLDKTDSNIGTHHAAQSTWQRKHSLQDTVNLTADSPITNSITTASSAWSTVSQKAKATFQTITNHFTCSATTACSHPKSIQAVNITFAHWCLAKLLPFNIGNASYSRSTPGLCRILAVITHHLHDMR